jgi:hypothetical protein
VAILRLLGVVTLALSLWLRFNTLRFGRGAFMIKTSFVTAG